MKLSLCCLLEEILGAQALLSPGAPEHHPRAWMGAFSHGPLRRLRPMSSLTSTPTWLVSCIFLSLTGPQPVLPKWEAFLSAHRVSRSPVALCSPVSFLPVSSF